MAMMVELELRIPTLSYKKEDDSTGRIDNTHVRFRKTIEVPEFPKPGTSIELRVGSEPAFNCTIERADWHETKQLFVLCCKYPKRRMMPDEYQALLNDPHWLRTEIL